MSKNAQSKQRKAVIYCRVLSAQQVTKGDGLNSQETRCREYAGFKGYQVIDVFRDEGVSGSLVTRPAMQTMLGFLQRTADDPHVVIIDDISRLARGLEAHIGLRAAINEAGGVLESPSIEFGEDSDSVLVENLLASVSQYQRQKNSEQVSNRMRARTLNGYWVFQTPVGYKYERVSGHGKVMQRKEPEASIIQEALEGYASGRFDSQAEVRRFLEPQPIMPTRNGKGEIHAWRITQMLTNPIYVGYIEVEKWNVALREGKHEGLIDFTTFEKIQEHIKGNAKAPARKDLNADFPLRGFITCECCGNGLTGAWSKGKYKHYAYYTNGLNA